MSEREIEIKFSVTMTMKFQDGIGFREARYKAEQALLDGDGGEGDYFLKLGKVKKITLKEGSE